MSRLLHFTESGYSMKQAPLNNNKKQVTKQWNIWDHTSLMSKNWVFQSIQQRKWHCLQWHIDTLSQTPPWSSSGQPLWDPALTFMWWCRQTWSGKTVTELLQKSNRLYCTPAQCTWVMPYSCLINVFWRENFRERWWESFDWNYPAIIEDET